jgi:hypothetical protein
MKDLPHHMKKLNRRVIRSEHRLIENEIDNMEEESIATHPTHIERPKEQLRKQAKSEMRKETLAHTPEHPTSAERNNEMKHRVPIFDRLNNPRPKAGARSKKKTPRI